MRRAPREHRAQTARGTGHRPRIEGHRPQRQTRHIMQGKGIVRHNLSKPRIGNHGPRTRSILLCGLKEQDDFTAARPMRGDPLRHTKHNRHMPIMPADMRNPVAHRGIGHIPAFKDRQSVQFTSYHHARAIACPAIDRSDPMTAQPRHQAIRPRCA